MPLDHYVSQVHLKNFYAPKLKNHMYAIRKQDLLAFKTKADAVCRNKDGSTNLYLQSERSIEEFLKGIEPKYNNAVGKLLCGQVDIESIYVIAGFVSYTSSCSPAGMRIKSEYLKELVREFAEKTDIQGGSPSPPPELGGVSLTELLSENKVNIEVDPKYPQAIGISSMLALTSMFGNFFWDIFINPYAENPFFTSDFPIAIEKTSDPRLLNRIVPLTPNLAIRIQPNPVIQRGHLDFTFKNFRYRISRPTRAKVMNINRLIVRCAESLVFFSEDYEWVKGFVKKNATFRIEPRVQKLTAEGETILLVSEDIVKTKALLK